MATSVKLNDDMKKRVQHLADVRHRSAHWIMRQAIQDYVEREENVKRLSKMHVVPGKITNVMVCI